MPERASLKVGDTIRCMNSIWKVTKLDGIDREELVTLYNQSSGPIECYLKDLFYEFVRGPMDLLKTGHLCPSKAFDLFTMATRFTLAYEYDRFASIGNSRTRLEPYQLAAVLKAITSLRTRLLLADDVGLGKSIEAGLIFKELEARGRANRVLLVVPASLIPQWQREMKEKFGVEFWQADRHFIKALGQYATEEKTPWDTYPLIITSIDFMKQFAQNEDRLRKIRMISKKIEERRNQLHKEKLNKQDLVEILRDFPELGEAGLGSFLKRIKEGKIQKDYQGMGKSRWDLIIIDEAHYCDKTSAGNGEAKGNARSRLAEALADRCDSLLLLTATPHTGDPMTLLSLVELLDPFLYRDIEDMKQNPGRIQQVMIRRSKDGILDAEGQPLFTNRFVSTKQVENWSKLEQEFYDLMSKYLRGGYLGAENRNSQDKRNLNFAMTILQKRMASSMAAIRLSLKRRLEHLNRRTEVLSRQDQSTLSDYIKNELDLADEEREEIEKKLESIPISESKERILEETADLQILINKADQISTDAKWETLRPYLRGLFQTSPLEKVIIFTEYRDTLNNLAEKLKVEKPWLLASQVKESRRPESIKDFSSLKNALTPEEKAPLASPGCGSFGESVSIICGGMNQKERIAAEAKFHDDRCRILLATDAASEGLNLQKKCHILINYELPWNPNRLEQRIGRVHRYGQKRDVTIYNLLNLKTREGEILDRLQKKIEEIRQALGSVGEVLGCVSKANIEEAIRASIRENISARQTATVIEQSIEEGRRICEEFQRIGLTKLQQFDNSVMLKIKGVINKSKDLEEEWRSGKFFQRLMSTFFTPSVSPRNNNSEFRVKIPSEFRHLVQTEEYDSVVFDKDHSLLDKNSETEFIGFGHPLVQGVIKKVLEGTNGGLGWASCKVLQEAECPGLLIHFRQKLLTQGIYFDESTGIPQPKMEPLIEELIPVFVSEGSISLEKGAEYSRAEGQKMEVPETAFLSFIDKIDFWKQQGEAAVRANLGTKLEQLRLERAERIRAQMDDLNRYQDGMKGLYEERIRKYERHQYYNGTNLSAPINRTRSDLQKLEEKVEKQKQLLQGMRQVVESPPQVVNAAWIIPAKLITSQNQAIEAKRK